MSQTARKFIWHIHKIESQIFHYLMPVNPDCSNMACDESNSKLFRFLFLRDVYWTYAAFGGFMINVIEDKLELLSHLWIVLVKGWYYGFLLDLAFID